jgi:hypothetical protein
LISGNRYSLLFIIISLIFSSFFIGCGLPDTQALLKPSRVTTTSSSILAFRTPIDTTDIQGYTLYYKVYYSQSDFLDERDDTFWFYEGTYINSEDEMQPGPYIPNQRGYIRVGELGGDSFSYPGFLISNPGDSVDVYIDFDWKLDRGFIDYESPDPIVLTVNPTPPVPSVLKTLARGIIDPTDSSDKSFRRFVKNENGIKGDWDYDDGSPNDNYNDADLRRKYPMPLTSSVLDITTFLTSGNPIIDNGTAQIVIGFVVHSYSLDVINLQPLYSKPEYIGAVAYTPINDTNRTTTTRP